MVWWKLREQGKKKGLSTSFLSPLSTLPDRGRSGYAQESLSCNHWECGQLVRDLRICGQAARTPGKNDSFFIDNSKCTNNALPIYLKFIHIFLGNAICLRDHSFNIFQQSIRFLKRYHSRAQKLGFQKIVCLKNLRLIKVWSIL